jgi:hypothetical protein
MYRKMHPLRNTNIACAYACARAYTCTLHRHSIRADTYTCTCTHAHAHVYMHMHMNHAHAHVHMHVPTYVYTQFEVSHIQNAVWAGEDGEMARQRIEEFLMARNNGNGGKVVIACYCSVGWRSAVRFFFFFLGVISCICIHTFTYIHTNRYIIPCKHTR